MRLIEASGKLVGDEDERKLVVFSEDVLEGVIKKQCVLGRIVFYGL